MLLVVEVLSSSTASVDPVLKADVYAAMGVPHYWVVDPATLPGTSSPACARGAPPLPVIIRLAAARPPGDDVHRGPSVTSKGGHPEPTESTCAAVILRHCILGR